MYEARSDHGGFQPIAAEILRSQGRDNLAGLLSQERVKRLFLHPVDHPMGYQDGISGIPVKRMDRRTAELTQNDKRKLYQIAEILLREVEGEDISPVESKELSLGVNQLIQSASWKQAYWRRNKEAMLERLVQNYAENDVKQVPEWDAQVAENKSMFHVSKLNSYGLKTIMWSVPSIIALAAYKFAGGDADLANGLLDVVGAGVAVGGLIMMADQYLILPLQDIFGGSPNTTKELQTGRQYGLSRHPLYSTRTVASMVTGFGSLNPFGIHSAINALYHYAKACGYQDERMRLIHGEKAIEHQKRTPAMIPGSQYVSRGLRKILPSNICDVLDTPVCDLLEKIGIKDNSYLTDDWHTFEGHFKGRAAAHIGSPLEIKATPLAIVAFGREFVDVGREIYEFASKQYRRQSKKLRRRRRQRMLERSGVCD